MHGAATEVQKQAGHNVIKRATNFPLYTDMSNYRLYAAVCVPVNYLLSAIHSRLETRCRVISKHGVSATATMTWEMSRQHIQATITTSSE